jgi:hypothetical protein
MDPNETLKKIRELVGDIQKEREDFETTQVSVELADSIDALDAWLISGGFLPEDWKPFPKD